MTDRASRSPSPRRRSRSRSRSASPDRSSRRSRSESPRGRSSRRPEIIAENSGNNLYVSGLSPRISESMLRDMFLKYGKVASVNLVLDPRTHESRGFAFVTMETVQDADASIAGISGTEVEGRRVSVEKAKRSRPRSPTPGKYMGRARRRSPPPRRGGGGGRYDPYRRSRSPSYRRSRSPYGRSRSPGGYGGRDGGRRSPRYRYSRSPSPYRGRSRSPRYRERSRSPYRR